MMDPTTSETLSAQLEIAALRALLGSWATHNDQLFQRAMRPPTLRLGETGGHLGRWDRASRTLEVSKRLLVTEGWGVVLEVLKHEMAHQFVDEVLRVHDETAHGPAFRQVCEARGIDLRAAGTPDGRGTPTPTEAVALERIAKLLALAESPDEHEAQAAMNAARRLMLKHNLDAAVKNIARGYVFKHLGDPSGRVDEAQRAVAMILHEHFFVETLWVPVYRVRDGRDGSVLEVCGTHDNVSMAEYVHSFLHHTAEALWTQHKRARRIAGDRDRRAFRAGVMFGFREKLEVEQRQSEDTGLVWVGDPELYRYFRRRWPRIRTVARGGGGSSLARAEGREAGRKLVLNKGMESRGHTGGGRLLGSGGD